MAPARRNGGKPAGKPASAVRRGEASPAAEDGAASEAAATPAPPAVSRETEQSKSRPSAAGAGLVPATETAPAVDAASSKNGKRTAAGASRKKDAAGSPPASANGSTAPQQPHADPGPAEAPGDPAQAPAAAAVAPAAPAVAPEAPVEESIGTGPDTAQDAAPVGPRAGELPTTAADPVTADAVLGTMGQPDAGTDTGELLQVPGARFAELPLDAIHPNRKQPRSVFDADEMAELVHSIREIGVLQPIVVRPSSEKGDAPYELVMGERRWRATREAGLETVPAIIRSTADDDLLRDALLENLHRSSLNPLEEAAAYQQLLDDFGCSHEELAERIGRSRPQISNTLRLMKLPPLVQRRIAAGVLSAGHARALLGLADQAEMEKLAQRIVAEGLSVRSTEEIVAMSDGLRRAAKPTSPRSAARHERLDYLATSLSDRLDTSVKITLGARKGKVSIEFASVDDLNRIMSVLAPPAS
ncbi:ParB/RepB/Spo0J family partition protein [Arthrobacter sp. TMN-37]